MAGARTVAGRRKASALRSARAASDDAAHSFAPFGALPPLIFLEANSSCRSLPKLGCGCIARTRMPVLSPRAGEGGSARRRAKQMLAERVERQQCAAKRRNKAHAEITSDSPHAETADARTGKRATQSGLCGDPRAVLSGDATVAQLPARLLPAASLLHRRGRPRRVSWAPLAADDGGRAGESAHRGHQGRPAAPATADVHGMELAPLSAVEFRPWMSGLFTLPCRGRDDRCKRSGWGSTAPPTALSRGGLPLQGRLNYSRTTCGSCRKFDGVTNTIRLAMTMVPARK